MPVVFVAFLSLIRRFSHHFHHTAVNFVNAAFFFLFQHATAENAWFTNVWGMFAEDCSAKSKSAYLSSSVSFFSRCRQPQNRHAFRLFWGRNNRLLDQRTLNCRIESFVFSVVIKNVCHDRLSHKK